jgi:GNAT superfamily N-acetyltransferase
MNPTTSPGAAGPSAPPTDVVLRPLRPEDLNSVVALDRISAGMPRLPYFEKRLQAALRYPRRHYQFALTTGKGLAGFLVARVAGGEYGRPEEVVVLEALGVEPLHRRDGLGKRMLAGLEELMRAHGIKQLVTQVDWHNHGMLQFIDGAGFSLAPRVILERVVDRIPLPSADEDIERWPPLVRQLKAEDFDAVCRIDKRITGLDRAEYFHRKFDEVLKQSAIEVSLVAEDKGMPVAFAMARVDFGDFGRVEPAASLDTIGVEPGFARKGFGRAVLSQMIENLAALMVERLETEVDRESFELQKFLYAEGFGTSQRLCFQKRI